MKTLTLKVANSLIGATITTHYNGYNGQNGNDTFTIGKIVSMYEIGKSKPYPNYNGSTFANFAEYWEARLSKSRIAELKRELEIITDKGRETSIRCNPASFYFNVPTFHCSDSDREVTYQILRSCV